MVMTRKIILLWLFPAFILPACSLFGDDGDPSSLEVNHHRWDKQDIVNYQFTLSVTCYCFPWQGPSTIVVRADTVHAVLNPKTGQTKRDPQTDRPMLEEYSNTYPTIDDLFEIIEDAIKRDPYRLEVDYNDKLGYPTQIDMEYSKHMTDDEILYEISAMKTGAAE